MSGEYKGVPDDQQHRFSISSRPINVAVIEAVAFVTGQDPLDCGPLYDAIDPDALVDVVSSTDDMTISFDMDGVAIQISGRKEITITEY